MSAAVSLLPFHENDLPFCLFAPAQTPMMRGSVGRQAGGCGFRSPMPLPPQRWSPRSRISAGAEHGAIARRHPQARRFGLDHRDLPAGLRGGQGGVEAGEAAADDRDLRRCGQLGCSGGGNVTAVSEAPAGSSLRPRRRNASVSEKYFSVISNGYTMFKQSSGSEGTSPSPLCRRYGGCLRTLQLASTSAAVGKSAPRRVTVMAAAAVA